MTHNSKINLLYSFIGTRNSWLFWFSTVFTEGYYTMRILYQTMSFLQRMWSSQEMFSLFYNTGKNCKRLQGSFTDPRSL